MPEITARYRNGGSVPCPGVINVCLFAHHLDINVPRDLRVLGSILHTFLTAYTFSNHLHHGQTDETITYYGKEIQVPSSWLKFYYLLGVRSFFAYCVQKEGTSVFCFQRCNKQDHDWSRMIEAGPCLEIASDVLRYRQSFFVLLAPKFGSTSKFLTK